MKTKKEEIDDKSKFLKELVGHYAYWVNKNPTYADAYQTLIHAFTIGDAQNEEV